MKTIMSGANLKNKTIWLVLSLAAIILFSLLIHPRSFDVSDTDAFYHIKHSWIYSQNDLTFGEFPWTQFSLVKEYGSDLWYGFHVLSIPLTYFNNLLQGIWVGGLIVTSVALVLIWLAIKRLPIKWPLLWTFAIPLFSADFLFRLTMFRPHPLSVGLSVLLFSFFCMSKGRRTLIGVLIASLFFAWMHLSLVWVPVLLWLAVSLSRLIQKSQIQWRQGATMIFGIAIGWLLRPHPIGAAKLAYTQVLQLLFEKQSHLPLSFGQELLPLVSQTLMDQLLPILALSVIALFFLLRFFLKKSATLLSTEIRVTALSSFIISGVFFILALAVARRSIDFFIPFGVIFLATTFFSANKEERQTILGKAHRAIIFIVVAVTIFGAIKNYSRFQSFIPHAFLPERFEEVGTWMKSNLPAEKTVFVAQWDYFPELFFWNANNYYINGMDPIFEYSYNPSLYWKTHYLSTDTFVVDNGVALVCGEVGCTEANLEDVRTIIKRDFAADYLFVDKKSNPKLLEFVEKASGFTKLYNGTRAAIYKIL